MATNAKVHRQEQSHRLVASERRLCGATACYPKDFLFLNNHQSRNNQRASTALILFDSLLLKFELSYLKSYRL
jgi:hypothetical protein